MRLMSGPMSERRGSRLACTYAQPVGVFSVCKISVFKCNRKDTAQPAHLRGMTFVLPISWVLLGNSPRYAAQLRFYAEQ